MNTQNAPKDQELMLFIDSQKRSLESKYKGNAQKFHNTFGDKFWSHLIFIINFWNKRDSKNWNRWSVDFMNKVRKDFNLDVNKYPLHIVGLNNFESYRTEITMQCSADLSR